MRTLFGELGGLMTSIVFGTASEYADAQAAVDEALSKVAPSIAGCEGATQAASEIVLAWGNIVLSLGAPGAPLPEPIAGKTIIHFAPEV